MEQNLFRKKSIDKISSPESLNDYIRISNPGVWLILFAVISLLTGVVIWGFFGHADTTVTAVADIKNKEGFCWVSDDDISSIKEGMPVVLDGKEGKVKKIGDYNKINKNYKVFIEADVKDGSYSAKIVTERVKPASFVLN